MKRVLTVMGLLIAVVLPTGCGSGHAARDVFSTQQVVKALAKRGIRLQASKHDLWGPADQVFDTSGKQAPVVTVNVLDPRDRAPYFLEPKDLRIYREMDSRWRWARRGNVLIGWLQLEKEKGTADEIRAALRSLRYSPDDAARLLRPKLELHPGESRTVAIPDYPQGTTVSCVSGSLEVDEYLTARTVAFNSARHKTREIVLRRAALTGSRRTYSCEERRVTDSSLGLHRNPTSCAPGPRTVRIAGIVARIPRGWYAAADRKQGFLSMANRSRCAVNWPTSTSGIYLQLWITSGGTHVQPGTAVRHFTSLKEVMDHGHVPGAYRATLFSAQHTYSLDIQMGAAAPRHHGLTRAKLILRGVTLPPSAMSLRG